MLHAIIGIVIVFVVYFGAMYLDSKFEARSFNNGICPKCGTNLKLFRGSQGRRGWKCSNCDYLIWISYPSVDRKQLKNETAPM